LPHPLDFLEICFTFLVDFSDVCVFYLLFESAIQVGNTGKINNGILEATSFKGWFTSNCPFFYKYQAFNFEPGKCSIADSSNGVQAFKQIVRY